MEQLVEHAVYEAVQAGVGVGAQLCEELNPADLQNEARRSHVLSTEQPINHCSRCFGHAYIIILVPNALLMCCFFCFILWG